MSTPAFFIDTANINDIERIWDKLRRSGADPLMLRGITTNPNALSKINCNTIKDFEITVYTLTRFLTRIGAKNGTVHIQMPQSSMTDNELEMWISYINSIGDGRTKITLKISPYFSTLQQLTSLFGFTGSGIDLNVTGVADAATALRCFSYPVRYVSIIPGRMEEVGIDATSHLRYVQQRKFTGFPETINDVITGSMRTVDGLRNAIQCGTIPTIGTRVWDTMTDKQYLEFSLWWNNLDILPPPPNYPNNIPFTDQRNVDLTGQFFEQMDALGKPLYDDFINATNQTN